MLLPAAFRGCVNHLNNMLTAEVDFCSKQSKTLFITFAGMPGVRKTLVRAGQRAGIGAPHFDFARSLREKDCDVLSVRDGRRNYYHSGVKGLGGSVDEVARSLQDTIQGRDYRLVVTLGHSMGAYASLLFAPKIGADICIAISPPTFLDSPTRRLYGDNRYAKEKDALCRMQNQPPCLDLRSYFESLPGLQRNKCSYLLFYGGADRLDRIHAERMAGLDSAMGICQVRGAGHNAARELRDSQTLPWLIDKVVSIGSRNQINSTLPFIQTRLLAGC